ncbi:hypothetical protein ACIBKX_26000 [Streptomyces sp. NPDC050658]|uniref:hypothetical protein n=1 Tax=unclassified Streptomyces TaxID=2593676 RepID=UPI003428BE5B
MDNIYPLDQTDTEGRYRADACFVLVNNYADISVTVSSLSVQGAQASLSDAPCKIPASPEASWNIGEGVTDPVNRCGSGTVLEPKSRSPRHGCSVRFQRDPDLAAATATLYVDVTAECVSRSPRPCSRLDARYSPSAGHPVTVRVTSSRTFEFGGPVSPPSGGSSSPETGGSSSSPETGKSSSPPVTTEPPTGPVQTTPSESGA